MLRFVQFDQLWWQLAYYSLPQAPIKWDSQKIKDALTRKRASLSEEERNPFLWILSNSTPYGSHCTPRNVGHASFTCETVPSQVGSCKVSSLWEAQAISAL
jgi:hypothetical protein